jgi:transcriptional regulator with XRE-family HTH domain
MLKGLKLREIAEKIGCSESLLSKIETGRVSPSLAVLGKIAQCLEVSMGTLFSPGNQDQVVTRAGQRQILCIHGPGTSVERLISPGGDDLLESNLHTLEPGCGSGSALSHIGKEVGYVLEGEFELKVGPETFLLQAGDSFTFRSEAAHSFRNPGKLLTRILWASTPSRSSTQLPDRRPPAPLTPSGRKKLLPD